MGPCQGDVGMWGMLPGVLGSAPASVALADDFLDVYYNLCEILVIRLHKGSNIDP